MSMDLKVAIVGAGPGGCMLGRLLSRRNISYTIFESESSPESRSQGGTLDLRASTGLKAIREAGLYDEFLKHARYDGEALLITDKDLNTWMRRSPGKQGKVNSLQTAPEIDRTVLRKILIESLPENAIRWNHKLLEVDDNCELQFANGVVESGYDLIVGADGAWSKVRNLLSSEKPFHTGLGGYSFTIPDAANTAPRASKFVNQGSVFCYSDGCSISGQQIGNGSLQVGVYAPKPEDWIETAGFDVHDLQSAKKDVKDYLKGWNMELLNLIDSAKGPVQTRNLYMLPVGFKPKHKAGITLLGDAAHLMTPFAGIGVNTALYDATLLADAISEAIDSDNLESLDSHIIVYEDKMYEEGHKAQQRTYDTMIDMLKTDGAPRTTIESWVLRHAKAEIPAWAHTPTTAAVYAGYFFYKLFI